VAQSNTRTPGSLFVALYDSHCYGGGNFNPPAHGIGLSVGWFNMISETREKVSNNSLFYWKWGIYGKMFPVLQRTLDS
jgi:hypothetical protein